MSVSTTHNSLPLNLILSTHCSHDHACLYDKSWCDTDLFNDRDVQVIRCRETRKCTYRRSYADMQVCSCPLKRALYTSSI